MFDNSISRTAAKDYDCLLGSEFLESTVAAIGGVVDAQSQPGVARQVCTVLRPRFIGRDEERAVSDAAGAVHRALKLFQAVLMEDPARLAAFPLPAPCRDLVQRIGTLSPGVMGRLDALQDAAGTARFMEFNPNPGGVFYFDMLSEAFLATPLVQSWSRRHPVTPYALARRVPAALADGFARAGGKGSPHVALVFDAPSATAPDGDASPRPESHQFARSLEGQRLVGMLQRLGIAHSIATFDDLAHVPGRGLEIDGRRVDAVFVEDWHAACGLESSTPLIDAARAGDVWLLNSAVDKMLLGDKAAFAWLSDPATNGFLPTPLRAAVERHIPWTRSLREGTTTYDGRDVDLVETVAAHKDRFVLKPCDGWGGTDVVLGRECDAAAWSRAVAQALARPFVVQERIEAVAEPLPVFEDGELRFVDHVTDLNPYVWSDATVHGMGARASRTALTNFRQGASLLPVIRLD